VRTRSAHGPDALDLLDAAWDRCLVKRGAAASPSLCAPWLRALGEGLAPPERALVVRVDDARGEMVAGAAFLVQPVGLGPARLWLGTWLGNHPRRVFRPGVVGGRAAPWAVARVLDTALGEVHALVLRDIPADLTDTWASVVPWCSRLSSGPDWMLSPLQPGLGRRVREVAYERRRAEARGALVTEELATEPEQVAAAAEVLLGLHRARWAGRRDPTGFSHTKADRALHRRALPSAAASGHVQIAVLREDGRPTAAACTLRVGAAGMLYRIAMGDPGVMRGPGVAAQTAAIRALDAIGVRAVDLGKLANDYKRRLGASAEPSSGLAVAASRRRQRALELGLAARARLRR
jgi:hypothetical protein